MLVQKRAVERCAKKAGLAAVSNIRDLAAMISTNTLSSDRKLSCLHDVAMPMTTASQQVGFRTFHQITAMPLRMDVKSSDGSTTAYQHGVEKIVSQWKIHGPTKLMKLIRQSVVTFSISDRHRREEETRCVCTLVFHSLALCKVVPNGPPHTSVISLPVTCRSFAP